MAKVKFAQIAVADGGEGCFPLFAALDEQGRVWHCADDGRWNMIEPPVYVPPSDKKNGEQDDS